MRQDYSDRVEELVKLHELLKTNAITAEEFNLLKKGLLAEPKKGKFRASKLILIIIVIALLFSILLKYGNTILNSLNNKLSTATVSNNKKEDVNNPEQKNKSNLKLARFHDIQEELYKKPQKEVVSLLGRPNVMGELTQCGYSFCVFMVYFDKVRDCKLPLKMGHGQLEFFGFSSILSTKRLSSIFEGFPFAVCG